MATVDSLRNDLINKLLSISNKEYLSALSKLIESNPLSNERIILTKEQKLMLELSENDIKNKNLISQKELDKSDLQWLKNL
ncbi:MAG: hypothetical protein V4667_13775 [Bacteroidota bacterium]